MYSVEVKNLSKVFYSLSINRKKSIFTALEDISFKTNSSEIFCLLGENGSGKTTLLKILTGLLNSTSGEIFINGYNLETFLDKFKTYIGLVEDNPNSFFYNLNGRENLRYFGSLYNLSSKQIKQKIDELTDLLRMNSFINKLFYTHSTGMRQRMLIARSLLHNPIILLMDEPMKGLDFETTLYLRKIIKEQFVLKEKKTVIFATCDPLDVEYFDARVALLKKGRIIFCGLFKEIKDSLSSDYKKDVSL